MKVLIVNVNSHEASTGKIAYGIYKYLCDKDDEAILCHRGVNEEKLEDPKIIALSSKWQCAISSVLSKFFGYEGRFSPISTFKLFRIIRKFKPDVVHLLNLPGYYVNHYALLEYLKENNIPTVYSMMDEFVYTGKCTYALDCDKFMTECSNCPQLNDYPKSWFFDNSKEIFYRKKRIYHDFELLTITGARWSCDRAMKSAISRNNKIVEIPHPINSKTMYYPRNTEALRKRLGIPAGNRVYLAAIPASFERKGGKYFMALAKKMLDVKDTTFVFVGYDRTDWEIPSNMITIGYVSDQNLLATYYSLADLYVCTSIADTFPTTCLNALACGTKIIGFKAGGVPFCAPEKFGQYVEPGDVDGFYKLACAAPKKTEVSIKETREFTCSHYSEEVVNGKFYEIYQNYMKIKK